MKPSIGTHFRFTGESNAHYTNGNVYEVINFDPNNIDVIGLTDNFGNTTNDGQGHYWKYDRPGGFPALFEKVAK